MKTIVVYFSFSGNNDLLANEIQQKMHCDKFPITEPGKRTWFTIFLDILFDRMPRIQNTVPNLANYDNIIFIAPIWAGKIAAPLKSFLLLNKNSIGRYSFITACSGGPGQKEKIESELMRLVEKRPVIVTELWINNLLPADQKNNARGVASYRLTPKDIIEFASEIDGHLSIGMKSNPLPAASV